jgi:hypothetical protein
MPRRNVPRLWSAKKTKVKFWCGYTIPVEPTLSKIPEKIQSPIAPPRRRAAKQHCLAEKLPFPLRN